MNKKKVTAFTGSAQTHPASGHKTASIASEQNIAIIRFEGVKVRVINTNGEPWFVAKDVCTALGLTDHKVPLRRLNVDEKEGYLIPTPGGHQSMSIISESGFYKLIARSRKATRPGTAAYRFSEWVFCEVIPSIRKTGAYGVPYAFLNDHSKRKAAYVSKASKRGKDLQACKDEKARLAAEEAALWLKYQPNLPEVH
ncbi:BRO family protein [Pantoea brenneri]|jgi:prophage antirepressor-like protein|uniref:BRO-N domain-containing protein n=1 Tax=Pantoea brenneri TaxID=472694 RepID=UPI0028A132FE|nr:BRO family protein [Pantoea brenneri]